MSKSLIFSVCAALLVTAGQATAADSAIPSNTLQAMGLSNATVVADQVSVEVRGMGYRPYSVAAGGSFAGVLSKKGAAAATLNVYKAKGRHGASGENYSEAGLEFTKSRSVDIGGVVKTVTRTKSVRAYAGGYSSALSF